MALYKGRGFVKLIPETLPHGEATMITDLDRRAQAGIMLLTDIEGFLVQVSDVFSRRVQPRSDSETSQHRAATMASAAFKMPKQAAPDAVKAEAESPSLAGPQATEREEQQSDQHEAAKDSVDGFKLRVKAPEPSRAIRTASGASG